MSISKRIGIDQSSWCRDRTLHHCVRADVAKEVAASVQTRRRRDDARQSAHRLNSKIQCQNHDGHASGGYVRRRRRNPAEQRVIYKHAGKMYMFDSTAAANNQAAINFQSQFDDDY
jgi:hypothetical protein